MCSEAQLIVIKKMNKKRFFKPDIKKVAKNKNLQF